MTRSPRMYAALGIGMGTLVLAGSAPGRVGAQATVGFAPPVFVDQVRAGGEPLILHSNKFGNLVYSSHEGTTHLDRVGAPSSSAAQFLCPGLTTADCYKNHVWIWTSDDKGKTWQLRDENLAYTGFSDPDLTEDAGGNIYDTGIDLANESVFSSPDGGKTWPLGTTQCNEGDRPWLAGGKAGEVFMTTDEQTPNGVHALFHSSNAAGSCDGNGLDSNGIPDAGTLPNGDGWSGFGKGIYDHFDGSFIEPAQFHNKDGSFGVGISRLANASAAFPPAPPTFHPTHALHTTTPASPSPPPHPISMDSAENL